MGLGGGGCDGPNRNANNIRSIIRYAGAPNVDPTSTPAEPLPVGCYDEQNLVPWVPTQVPKQLPKQLSLGFTTTLIQPGLVQWLIDGSPMKVDFKRPTLLQISNGNTTFDKQENVYYVGEANKVLPHTSFLLSNIC